VDENYFIYLQSIFGCNFTLCILLRGFFVSVAERPGLRSNAVDLSKIDRDLDIYRSKSMRRHNNIRTACVSRRQQLDHGFPTAAATIAFEDSIRLNVYVHTSIKCM
jgi:hypothetical protein